MFHGSAAGLGADAAATREPNQAGARYGHSVAGDGDLNRDGYSDILIGAPLYDNDQLDEGRVFVIRGTATGIASGTARTLERGQASASFGASVAMAGDVNGDLYSDLIIGSPTADSGEVDEGRAFVFLGNASLAAMALGTTVEGNQAAALFGTSVASAGDVNGDGYGDVIVGAPGHDAGEPDEGRASWYLGSASGVGTAAAWTANGDQPSASLGTSVAAAGDVNGDGYGDVVVGARLHDGGQADDGRALVYLGNGGDGLDRIARAARLGGSAPIDALNPIGEGAVQARCNGRTPFGRGRVRLEVEFKGLTAAFNGLNTRKSAFTDTGAPGPGGSVVPFAFDLQGMSTTGVSKWSMV